MSGRPQLLSGTDPGPKLQPWAVIQDLAMRIQQRNTALRPLNLCIAVQHSDRAAAAVRAYSLCAKGSATIRCDSVRGVGNKQWLERYPLQHSMYPLAGKWWVSLDLEALTAG